jgi:uncharacterized membrane protein YozB (DUF420 family)
MTLSIVNKFWRIGLSFCLTAFASFWMFVYLYLYYDELHIKSTDYQLKDNLTYTQVISDIAKTTLVTSALSAIIAVCVYGLNKVESMPRSGRKVAIWCWCFMIAIIVYLSVYHYRETSNRMENERQWRLQNQRS